MGSELIRSCIREVPNFPREGILFRDLHPLMKNPEAFAAACDGLTAFALAKGATVIVGPEARGFCFGCPAALAAKVGFVPARKEGKLPGAVRSVEYGLEYGTAILNIQQDSLTSEDRVLIIDDLLATGGTVKAISSLVKSVGATVVGAAFVVELCSLNGREGLELNPNQILSLVQYH